MKRPTLILLGTLLLSSLCGAILLAASTSPPHGVLNSKIST